MKINYMNVVFATDREYLQHLAVALASLLENNSRMKVYVINSDISGNDWKNLETIFTGKDSKLINARFNDRQIENLITHSYFTKAMYYRLFIPDIVVGDKALYLDADIVVKRKIEELYNTDISKTFVAAVNNPGIHHHDDLGMKYSSKYFNSGVLLINLAYWRKYKIKEKIVDFVGRAPGVIQFPDQDGLNAVIDGTWLELHPKYNMHTVLLFEKCGPNSQITEAINDPVIVHYTGSSKPWHLGDTHPYKHLYWKYLRMTPYKYSLPSKPLSFFSLNNLRRMIPKPIKERIKKIIKWEV